MAMPGPSTPEASPADARVAQMPPNLLSGVLAIADEHGLPTDDWLADLRLDRGQLADPATRVSPRQTAELIERAQHALPPGTGLEIGARQHIGNFGLLGLAMTTAATFGEAVAIGMRYTPVVGGLMRFVESDSELPATAALRMERTAGSERIHRFVCEEFLGSCLALARGLVGPELRPRLLEFSYPAPDYRARYDEVFDCPIAFDRPQDRLVFDARWFAVPLATHNPAAARQVMPLLRAQMPADAPGEVTAAVERLLRARLSGEPHLRDIAALLHVSERTLRRQLTAEGTGFRALLDRVRVDRAYALLRDRSLTIYQVGAAIGYRDPREFRRAFRRLTGSTPRAARERLLAP